MDKILVLTPPLVFSLLLPVVAHNGNFLWRSILHLSNEEAIEILLAPPTVQEFQRCKFRMVNFDKQTKSGEFWPESLMLGFKKKKQMPQAFKCKILIEKGVRKLSLSIRCIYCIYVGFLQVTKRSSPETLAQRIVLVGSNTSGGHLIDTPNLRCFWWWWQCSC